MFAVGDYIIYGNNGVCKVETIGLIDYVSSNGRLYYTLTPIYTKGSKVFTPIDNDKVIMRPIITKEEAMKLVDDITIIDVLWIQDERKREECYKQSLKTCDCRELIKIIKELYLRKQSRIAEGKKVTSSDERYMSLGEESLYGELALALRIERTEVKDYLTERVNQKNTISAM